jgi:hypothetical protein
VSGGKNSKAHFVWKCGLCIPSFHFTFSIPVNTISVGKRESSAKFESTAFIAYNNENAQFAPLLVLDCRGLEFIGFDPRVMSSPLTDKLRN